VDTRLLGKSANGGTDPSFPAERVGRHRA
jgi:hypothetical protein